MVRVRVDETNPLRRVPPHLMRRDFLAAGEHAALRDWALGQEHDLAPSTVGGAGAVVEGTRNSMRLRSALPRESSDALSGRVLGALPELLDGLGLAPFPVESVVLSLVVYNDGAFYRRHVDTATGGRDAGKRMLTGVYYFHREPQGYSGGALRLHPLSAPPEGEAPFVDIAPAQNSLAVFPSWAPHEVRPVACPSGRYEDSRFAINCWVRRAG
ncbi:MAG: 2OG-Fe(II) oxygenase [Pseudomonadota bacterium]